ncbi:MAG: 4Fe-4S binding protein [Clostridiales bacterium]|nr:4Fe-4S binding protein [Clostridiales bacterium]
MKHLKRAEVNKSHCVACGCCVPMCPRGAIYIKSGVHAEVNNRLCTGCGICSRECPASLIAVKAVRP